MTAPVDPVREYLDGVAQRSDAATEGPWTAKNMADDVYDSDDGNGWWWVWREEINHYAGVLEVDREFDDKPGAVGTAAITDNRSGATERADAEFIAAARLDVPMLAAAVEAVLALADEADAESATVHPMWIRRAVAAYLDPKENHDD